MSRWSRKRPAAPDPQVVSAPIVVDGKTLPGIAGYQGIGRLPKNAMPVVRFGYVRPDGKPDHSDDDARWRA